MAVLFVKLWEHRPGITFFTGLVLYSAMRFGVSYLRIDSCPSGNLSECPEHVIRDWMTFPQVVSMVTFAVGVAGLAWSLRRAPQPSPGEAPPRPQMSQPAQARQA
jgi:prolipoprotein diacylglyceryltransferase